jgi:hypothetical protein
MQPWRPRTNSVQRVERYLHILSPFGVTSKDKDDIIGVFLFKELSDSIEDGYTRSVVATSETCWPDQGQMKQFLSTNVAKYSNGHETRIARACRSRRMGLKTGNAVRLSGAVTCGGNGQAFEVVLGVRGVSSLLGIKALGRQVFANSLSSPKNRPLHLRLIRLLPKACCFPYCLIPKNAFRLFLSRSFCCFYAPVCHCARFHSFRSLCWL